jgi:Holliday junction resolvase RusA-like endonuclease
MKSACGALRKNRPFHSEGRNKSAQGAALSTVKARVKGARGATLLSSQKRVIIITRLNMISFLCTFRPRSVNAKALARYKEKIIESYKKYYPDHRNILDEDIYGISYYFYKRKHQLDADNLSKPIWDALNTIVYKDDKIIKLRYSGIYDMSKAETEIDLTRMARNIYSDFIDYIDKYDDIIYIEIGKLREELYVIGAEDNDTV